MARGRMISATLGESHKFARLQNDTHRLLFILLITHTDVNGRVDADPIWIRGKVATRLPMTVELINEALQDLHEVELITLYQVQGKAYLQINKFDEHNRVRKDREAPGGIPGPDEGKPVVLQHVQDATQEDSRSDSRQAPAQTKLSTRLREEKLRKDLSADADDSPEPETPNTTFEALAEIWNAHSGNLRKVRDLEAANNNPELQKLAKAFLKRHGARAEEIFTAGIAAVTTDPHWLGRKATPVKRSGAPYGLLNYLRHVEDKAEIAAELQATSSGPAVGMPSLPSRPWEAYDIAQHHATGEVATIHELLADGQARMSNGETWTLSECDRCNN